MRGVGIAQFGGPEQLELRDDWPLPEPARGEARVRVAMAGVNYIDIYMRSGQYAKSQTYQTPLPMLLGMEGAGTVDALGEGVTDLAVGDRVAWCVTRGAYADFAVVPAWKLVPVPEGVDWAVATALQLQGSTAHYLTHSLFALQPGHTCLVHAGAGGVGQLLIQLAKSRGARVLATVGTESKATIAMARGADATILYRHTDFRAAVRTLTQGAGVDVVYDSVGKDTVHDSIRCLKRRGTCVMFGASSGQVEGIAPLELAEAGSVFFTRPHLADYLQPHEVRQRAAELFTLVADERLSVAVERTYGLAAVAEAHRHIEGRNTRGKLLVDVAAP
ncbi:quinone oxidoreductase [Methylibium sp.]|uniref:quinone oxidoreductase family protein n=1 Tax=Methylibium sp. TaxID=2067992 RepID=UPI0017AD33AE|nr:quinone oxidoreductase [Methylibium sp.]MBA3590409.1 quinone oxidoreductase [Methylibium sp.]